MKKIFILLAAAVAALSSCVEENALAPETKEGNVTIKAVSADSKTLLDGTDVVWENTDKIAVVLDDKDVTTVEFSVKGEANGANATFTGTIEPELEYTSAYAVYPASAVVDGVVSHTLPEVQTGVVTSGMNLSSALLDAEQLQAGEAVGTFHNALVLLQVVVPAGMQEISLTSDDYLVGPTDFYVLNGVLSRKTVLKSATVTLKTGSELAQGTHSLLVYPVKGGLTIYMKGTDGTEYTKAVSTPKFEASMYYTLDFTKIFNMQTTEVMAASPAGEELVVPIVSVNDYEYSVSVEGNPDWITYTLPTKGFHGEEILFNVKKNDSGVERYADVTISWGDESTRTFKITQKALFMDFVEDAEGNPIQWEETFGLYADAELKTQLTTFTNVFTIALSDDFSKGTYKISNMFKVDSYWNNGQQVTNKGGEYYANYDAENGELTVLKENSASGYTFTGNVVLAYDAVNKTFSAEKIQATLLYGSSYYDSGATRYLGNYAAAVKVEEPADGFDISGLCGTYNESVKDPYSYANTTETLVISASDNPSYDLKMLFFYTPGEYGSYDTAYGTVSADGKTITVIFPSGSSNYFGEVSDFNLTVEGNVISGQYAGTYAYSATKLVDLSGTYSGSGNFGLSAQFASSNFSETFAIQKNNDSKGDYVISGLFCVYGSEGVTSTYYANYSDGILTILAANSSNHQYVDGGLSSDVTMTYSDGSLVLNEAAMLSPYCVVASYSATKE